jgi:hypothetical protein
MVENVDRRNRAMEALTPLLLYLASWEEEPIRGAPTIRCAWKNHRFEILDALAEEVPLTSTRRAESVGFPTDGVSKARVLQRK